MPTQSSNIPDLLRERTSNLVTPLQRLQDLAARRVSFDEMFKTYDYFLLPSADVFPFDADVHWPPANRLKENGYLSLLEGEFSFCDANRTYGDFCTYPRLWQRSGRRIT
jgi:hypothetical protein